MYAQEKIQKYSRKYQYSDWMGFSFLLRLSKLSKQLLIGTKNFNFSCNQIENHSSKQSGNSQTMKLKHLLYTFVLFIGLQTSAQTEIFDAILAKNVDAQGNVNYKGIDKTKLNAYLEYLNNTNPASFSTNKAKAFWSNAYNAYTIQLILEHYPVKSIMDIKVNGKGAWDIPFAKVGGKTYTLNHIEHEILRKKYKDPRIHVAVNCASFSCPPLYNKAFTAENIDGALTALMKKFINDSKRNKIRTNKAELSEIFNWFKSDFTQNGSLVNYINTYSNTKINNTTAISYLPYNWNLNKK